MPTLKELLEIQATEKIGPKVLRLIERIGRLHPNDQMRLVKINHKIKIGKTVGKNDVDFIDRLAKTI